MRSVRQNEPVVSGAVAPRPIHTSIPSVTSAPISVRREIRRSGGALFTSAASDCAIASDYEKRETFKRFLPNSDFDETQSVIAGSQLLSRSRNSDASRWHVLSEQLSMNCARLRLNAETTTIFVRDGWLIIEASEIDALQGQLAGAHGDRLLTVAEVGQRTGFTAGAVRDWIKRSVLAAVRVGKEYRVREADLARLLDGKSRETASISKRIDRRRKAISA